MSKKPYPWGTTQVGSEKNLLDGLMDEIKRVRAIIKVYEGATPEAGKLAVKIMEMDIDAAEAAIKEMDVVRMLIALKSLRGYSI